MYLRAILHSCECNVRIIGGGSNELEVIFTAELHSFVRIWIYLKCCGVGNGRTTGTNTKHFQNLMTHEK